MRAINKILGKLIGIKISKLNKNKAIKDWLKSMDIKTIIDVGANIGQFASEARSLYPLAQIYSFEPIKKCFSELQKNFKNDKNFQAFNKGVGAIIGKTEITVSTYSPSSSLLPMTKEMHNFFPQITEGGKEAIDITTLDSELVNKKMSGKIMLKIDTQGYEDKVLAGATNLLKIIDVVIIENSFFRFYENQPLFEDIFRILSEKGFKYRGNIAQKIDKTGMPLFEDSVFIKN